MFSGQILEGYAGRQADQVSDIRYAWVGEKGVGQGRWW